MTSPPSFPKPGSKKKEERTGRVQAATELSVPIGPRVVELLDVAYRARRPILLEGPTGIGKSQIVGAFAKASGLDVVVLDLSLLEPPDLVGLPVIEGGRTHYACPAELPREGRGVLMLEELNRAEIPVMQPALQLLSARKLHSYELPDGWTCVAAVNPEDGDYQVNRLDPALRSRFLQLSVCAERASWLGWAARANVHALVLGVVRDHPDAFDDASPRSWAYASELLHVLRPGELGNRDLVRVALRGYLPPSWSMLVVESLAHYPDVPELDPDRMLEGKDDAPLARLVKRLSGEGRIDAIAWVASKLRRSVAGPRFRARVEEGAISLASLEKLLAPLPGDLREQCLESAARSPAAAALLAQMGHAPDRILSSYEGSALRKELRTWRREMTLHRVELVVTVVGNWLDETRHTQDHLTDLAPQIAMLGEDAGPLGEELLGRLRARDLLPETTS